MLILVVATIDLGMLIQARLIISNVSREGGSIASREMNIDTDLTGLLQASGRPLDLGGADGKIFITRLAAGTSAGAPSPTIAAQISAGTLGVSSKIAAASAYLGLSRSLYDHLVFSTTNGTSDISEITVVEIYYKYRPVTPVPTFMREMLLPDGDGAIVWSKAVF
jgi:hypothetical protein